MTNEVEEKVGGKIKQEALGEFKRGALFCVFI